MKNPIKYLFIVILLLFVVDKSFAQEDPTPTQEMLSKLLESREEPNWPNVYVAFKNEYPGLNADSLAAYIKFSYYGAKKDWEKYTAFLINFGNTYGQDWTPKELNSSAWTIFKYSQNRKELQTALDWSKRSLSELSEEENDYPNFLDTYANLLYKLGEQEEALRYEWKAFSLSPATRPYLEPKTGRMEYGLNKKKTMIILFKMERGEPTWPVPEEEAAVYRQSTVGEDNPYWQRVKDKWLHKEYGPKKADSILYQGKLFHYDQINNKQAYMKVFVAYMEKYGNGTMQQKNSNAWEVFLKSDHPKELKKALGWSEETIKDRNNEDYYAYLDTYANLLYKLGDKPKAIKYQKRALALSPENQKSVIQATLDKMKNGEKTWK